MQVHTAEPAYAPGGAWPFFDRYVRGKVGPIRFDIKGEKGGEGDELPDPRGRPRFG